MNDNEVWIKVGEGGFRHHATNKFVVLKKYKRKEGYAIYFKEKGFNGFWRSQKLGEAYSILNAIVFLENYKKGFWRVSEEDIIKALREQGWREELEELKTLGVIA